eukprot:270921-Lingulodinium_polyedra.AAC.1
MRRLPSVVTLARESPSAVARAAALALSASVWIEMSIQPSVQQMREAQEMAKNSMFSGPLP